jgi:hypothetical protein
MISHTKEGMTAHGSHDPHEAGMHMFWLLITGFFFALVIGLWMLGMCRAGSREAKTLPVSLPKVNCTLVRLSGEKERGELEGVLGPLRPGG